MRVKPAGLTPPHITEVGLTNERGYPSPGVTLWTCWGNFIAAEEMCALYQSLFLAWGKYGAMRRVYF